MLPLKLCRTASACCHSSFAEPRAIASGCCTLKLCRTASGSERMLPLKLCRTASDSRADAATQALQNPGAIASGCCHSSFAEPRAVASGCCHSSVAEPRAIAERILPLELCRTASGSERMLPLKLCRTASGSARMPQSSCRTRMQKSELRQNPGLDVAKMVLATGFGYIRPMRNEHEFSDERIPLAYHITFRAYGTWLHGREGSVDRFHNRYGEPRLPRDDKRLEYNRRLLKQPPVYLPDNMRAVILSAIKETCEIRKWALWISNIRSNHVHAVVTATCKPKRILNAFKANATRHLREARLWKNDRGPWSRGGSKIYLWNEKALYDAICYVLYEQGD
jgi:REP element-mobilizing transposase RayT